MLPHLQPKSEGRRNCDGRRRPSQRPSSFAPCWGLGLRHSRHCESATGILSSVVVLPARVLVVLRRVRRGSGHIHRRCSLRTNPRTYLGPGTAISQMSWCQRLSNTSSTRLRVRRLAIGFGTKPETPSPGCGAVMRDPQEFERLRFPRPALLAPNSNEAGFIAVKAESEFG